MVLLSVKHVSFQYKHKVIFNDLSFENHGGQIVGIVSPNGTGKTTLFDLLAGNFKPTSGTITLDQYDYAKNWVLLKKSLVKMPMFHDLVPNLTGYDHLLFYANSWRIPKEHIALTIEKFKMNTYIHDKVSTYSLGMKQRICFAMTVITNAKVLLLDEITNGLDQENLAYVKQLLKELQQDNKLIFIISHTLDTLDELCDVIYFLKDHHIFFTYDLSKKQDKLISLTFRKPNQAQAFIKEHVHLNTHISFNSNRIDLPIDYFSTLELQKLCQTEYNGLYHITVGQKSCLHIYEDIYTVHGGA